MFAIRTASCRLATFACARPAVFATAASIKPFQPRFYSNKLTPGSAVLKYASEAPKVKYTQEHEWIALHNDQTAFLGITKYAADALGEATYIEASEEGTEFDAHDSVGSVESVKSASELYSPVAGEVVAVNEDLVSNPAIVNQDPMGEAWFVQIKVADPAELESLMDFEQYEDFIKGEH